MGQSNAQPGSPQPPFPALRSRLVQRPDSHALPGLDPISGTGKCKGMFAASGLFCYSGHWEEIAGLLLEELKYATLDAVQGRGGQGGDIRNVQTQISNAQLLTLVPTPASTQIWVGTNTLKTTFSPREKKSSPARRSTTTSPSCSELSFQLLQPYWAEEDTYHIAATTQKQLQTQPSTCTKSRPCCGLAPRH